MQTLTKAEAIANHRKMWNWIADETEKRGEKVEKKEYFDEMGINWADRPDCSCYCCEYARQNCPKDDDTCEYCPIEWPNGKFCGAGGSPYKKWDSADSPAEAAKLAREIAELPEREEAE